jgi:hypothetical protein
MAGLTGSTTLQMLQQGIDARQKELQRVADVLARAAQRFRRRAGLIRVLLILAGALTATQGALEKAFAASETQFLLGFTFLGVLISVLAGLEAAFKFEARASELSLLAASCHSTLRHTDATWYRQVGIAADEGLRVAGAMTLIELQDSKLSDIQEKAATSGINIALEIRKDVLNAIEFEEQRVPSPYPA